MILAPGEHKETFCVVDLLPSSLLKCIMATDSADNPLLDGVGGGVTREELREMLREVVDAAVKDAVPKQTNPGTFLA